MVFDREKQNKQKLLAWVKRLRQDERVPSFAQTAQAALDQKAAEKAPAHRGSLYRKGLTLADLKPGECGTVQKLLGNTEGRLRLLEMGLTPGVHIKVVRVAAFGGPLDVTLRGYQLSLRRDEAASVWLDDDDAQE